MHVVLYGDHGGELDRERVEISNEDEDTTDGAIGEAIARLSRRCVFHPGDSIVVEQ